MRDGLTVLRTWLQASRLPSQSYIALPLLLGQVVAARMQGRALDLGTLVGVQLFGLLDQLFIVYANDWADQETDRRNRTPTLFSGGSRVLVEGRLPARALGLAALVCAGALLALSVGLAVARGAPLLVPLAVAALALLWAYSYPPLRLSYRGGGELLQMVGVAGVLPLYGYVAQGGALGSFPWALLALLLPTHLGCAIATAAWILHLRGRGAPIKDDGAGPAKAAAETEDLAAATAGVLDTWQAGLGADQDLVRFVVQQCERLGGSAPTPA